MQQKTTVIRVSKELARYYKTLKKKEKENLEKKFKKKVKRLLDGRRKK